MNKDSRLGSTQNVLRSIPGDAAARKAIPAASGVLDYFPLAILEIARLSKAGNDQHNPGEPLNWAREKSRDHADCLIRHFLERGTLDTDGLSHTVKVAWRALAMLQEELEARAGWTPDAALYQEELDRSDFGDTVPVKSGGFTPEELEALREEVSRRRRERQQEEELKQDRKDFFKPYRSPEEIRDRLTDLLKEKTVGDPSFRAHRYPPLRTQQDPGLLDNHRVDSIPGTEVPSGVMVLRPEADGTELLTQEDWTY